MATPQRLGHLPFSQAGSALVFHLISKLYERTSLGDNTLADTILDRLMHNAHRLQLKGESMRSKRLRTDTLFKGA